MQELLGVLRHKILLDGGDNQCRLFSSIRSYKMPKISIFIKMLFQVIHAIVWSKTGVVVGPSQCYCIHWENQNLQWYFGRQQTHS